MTPKSNSTSKRQKEPFNVALQFLSAERHDGKSLAKLKKPTLKVILKTEENGVVFEKKMKINTENGQIDEKKELNVSLGNSKKFDIEVYLYTHRILRGKKVSSSVTIEIEDSDLKMYDKNDLTAIQFAQLYTIETLKKTNAEVKELKVSFKILQKVSSSLLKRTKKTKKLSKTKSSSVKKSRSSELDLDNVADGNSESPEAKKLEVIKSSIKLERENETHKIDSPITEPDEEVEENQPDQGKDPLWVKLMKGRVAHNTDNTEDLSNDSEDDDESDSGPNFAEPRDIKPLPVENQVQEVKDSPAKDRKDDENVEDQITEIEPLLNRKKSLAKAPKATNVVKTKDNRILKFENAPIRNINPDDF